MTAQPSAPPSIEVRRTIRASQQRCFDAWTKADELRAWHAPGPLTVSLAEIDLRPGGRYRIHMRTPEGMEHKVSGEYREVDPPRKVSYTWSWEADHGSKNSLVTIEFHARGEETEVVLTHAGMEAEADRASHLEGWTSIMDKFADKYGSA